MNSAVDKVYFKHQNLPIPDLFVSIDIDAEARTVTLNLDHFDSALVVQAAQWVERERGVHIIDAASGKGWGRAHIDEVHELRVTLYGQTFYSKIVQLAVPCGGTEITVTLQAIAP
jgi:hypothetical protein